MIFFSRTLSKGERLVENYTDRSEADLGEGGIVEVRREEKLGGCCTDVGTLIKIG